MSYVLTSSNLMCVCVCAAMFSLFVCVTQDGWMSITRELNECGNGVLGAIYLLIFITIGAFIFANLVVAVVVTNLVSASA